MLIIFYAAYELIKSFMGETAIGKTEAVVIAAVLVWFLSKAIIQSLFVWLESTRVGSVANAIMNLLFVVALILAVMRGVVPAFKTIGGGPKSDEEEMKETVSLSKREKAFVEEGLGKTIASLETTEKIDEALDKVESALTTIRTPKGRDEVAKAVESIRESGKTIREKIEESKKYEDKIDKIIREEAGIGKTVFNDVKTHKTAAATAAGTPAPSDADIQSDINKVMDTIKGSFKFSKKVRDALDLADNLEIEFDGKVNEILARIKLGDADAARTYIGAAKAANLKARAALEALKEYEEKYLSSNIKKKLIKELKTAGHLPP
jgi:O6-methylguanine-DNA--protein-cysteine methyltransferase